jgi:hypothetical protein
MHACIHLFIHYPPFTHPLIHPSTHPFTHSLVWPSVLSIHPNSLLLLSHTFPIKPLALTVGIPPYLGHPLCWGGAALSLLTYFCSSVSGEEIPADFSDEA